MRKGGMLKIRNKKLRKTAAVLSDGRCCVKLPLSGRFGGAFKALALPPLQSGC